MRRKLFGQDVQDKRYPGPARRSLESGSAESSSGSSTGVPAHVLPLNESLGKHWAEGLVTSKQVVQYCGGAVALGAHSEQLDKFAECATWGKHGQNCQRDLMKAFGQPTGAPALYRARLPVKGKKGQQEFSDHPFVLPHELFAKIFQERRGFFNEHVLSDGEKRRRCWDALERHPFVQENEAWSEAKAAGLELVPLGLHCDAGAFNKNESLYALTWNSLVGQGTTKQKRYIITVLKKSSLLADGSTLAAMWRVVAWSLNALASGRHPSKDHDDADLDEDRAAIGGNWLAEGVAGITLQMRGDWQWYRT